MCLPCFLSPFRMTEEKDARNYLETMASKLTSDVDRIKSQYHRMHLQVSTYVYGMCTVSTTGAVYIHNMVKQSPCHIVVCIYYRLHSMLHVPCIHLP